MFFAWEISAASAPSPALEEVQMAWRILVEAAYGQTGTWWVMLVHLGSREGRVGL